MKKAKILKILSLVIVIALITCIVLTMTLTPSAATKVKEESFVKDGLGLVLGEDYDYSFAVVGDTQSLNYGDISNGTSYMNGLYQWIIDNISA